MRRVLVIQLCRLGDVLQTTPLLRGLRAQPGTHITLVLLDGFGHAPLPRELYDDLVLFPFERVAALVRAEHDRWPEALELVRAAVAPLCDGEPFDFTLNVSGSPLSNFIAAIVPSARVDGGTVAADRTRVVNGGWTTYFWASQLARHQGCFNLVDLMAWSGGVAAGSGGLEIEATAEAHARIREWLRGRGAGEDPLIAIQLGASDERKRWPPERFAETVNRLPEALGRIVFVGTAGERPLFERARAVLRRPALDAVGETSVAELAALLSRCRLLLTNDTGTMHVAAAVGTTVVDLSTGPVFVHETGPYGEGHIAVEPASACFPCLAGAECRHLSCREDFTPDDIAAVVRYALDEGPMPKPARAKLLRAGRTASGRLQYFPIWSPVPTRNEVLRRASADMWERTLGVPAHRPDAPAASRHPSSFLLPLLSSGAREFRPPSEWQPDGIAGIDRSDPDAFRQTREALARLAAHARAGADAARDIRGADPGAQAALSAEIDGLLQRMTIEGQLDAACHPIVSYLRVATESTAEHEIEVVARAYEREFTAAGERAKLLIQLLGGIEDERVA